MTTLYLDESTNEAGIVINDELFGDMTSIVFLGKVTIINRRKMSHAHLFLVRYEAGSDMVGVLNSFYLFRKHF